MEGDQEDSLGSAANATRRTASILFLDFLREYLPLLQSVYLGFGTGLFKPLVYGGIAGSLGGQHLDFDLPCRAQMDLEFGDFSLGRESQPAGARKHDRRRPGCHCGR